MHQLKAGLSIDVYSDVVCPWCYIGKRRLEQALEAVKGRDATTVIWRPFQLNPTMPKAGMDRRVYLEAKFGRPGELKAIQDRVAAVGAKTGVLGLQLHKGPTGMTVQFKDLMLKELK